jgi:trans-2,3-dihydro-3-hydroxyanthranilate isomerase
MRGPQKAGVPLGLKYHHVDVFSSKPLSGNGVTVFLLRKALPGGLMQELTREMRQFESIFVLQEARSQTVRTWVFTMEEELDFAGHPAPGAAAALHEETMAGIRKVSWMFQLNRKSFPVQTIRQDSHYRAEMDQGVCNFGATLSPQESVPFLEALNLTQNHLLDKLPLQIASTGLPYLLVPVNRDLDVARII